MSITKELSLVAPGLSLSTIEQLNTLYVMVNNVSAVFVEYQINVMSFIDAAIAIADGDTFEEAVDSLIECDARLGSDKEILDRFLTKLIQP
jgi:hypothetical protein